MSASRDEDTAKANANQEGEFGSRVPPTAPQTTQGHQPGRIATKEDAAPESSIEILPPGSAPASKSFVPRPDADSNTPRQDPTNDPTRSDAGAPRTAASETLGGATSADVHTGLGHPGAGMSSAEQHDASNRRAGLQGVGAEGAGHASQMPEKKLDTESPIPGQSQKLAGGRNLE